MSGDSSTGAPRRGNFASRKARGEHGGGGPASSSTKDKGHGYDARFYHQNANTHGIHALRNFDCPVCESKNTIRIDLHARLGQGTVRCTYCMSLRPIPEDLPYPHTTSYVPALENKADVFFKFNEKYGALLKQQQQEQAASAGEAAGPSNAPTRKRARDDDDESVKSEMDHVDRSAVPMEEGEGGLFGSLSFILADPEGLEGGVGNVQDGTPPRMLGLEDDHGAFGEGGEVGKMTSDAVLPPQSSADVVCAVADGVEDVDIAEFFADSD